MARLFLPPGFAGLLAAPPGRAAARLRFAPLQILAQRARQPPGPYGPRGVSVQRFAVIGHRPIA